MAIKKLITGQPKADKTSQYNFKDSEITFNYENSIGLPPPIRNDKFTEKDLYTNSVGDKVNEVIIENNLKFPGNPFFRIDNLVINNAGVKHRTGDVNVKLYLFSRKSFTEDNKNTNDLIPEECTYAKLNDILNQSNSPYIFYNENFSKRGRGQGLGNIEVVEGVNVIEDFSGTNEPDIGDLPGNSFDSSEALKREGTDTDNTVFDTAADNPIYIGVYMKGNSKRGRSFWKFTDRRKKRIQIYKVSNLELYENFLGKVVTIQFENDVVRKTGGGGGGGREAAAFIVGTLNVTFNTVDGQQNDNVPVTTRETYEDEVNPRQPFFPSAINDNLFLTINPNRQLNNNDDNAVSQLNKFPDYFVKTKFSVVNLFDELTDVDLQTYHVDSENALIASTPSSVSFDLEFVDPQDYDLNTEINNPLNGDTTYGYFYFVINWDDKNDDIKTIDDFLSIRPDNLFQLLKRQDENLFITNYKSFTNGIENPIIGETLSNVYTTPGIKTIKIISISYNEETREVGRWKLITSRIFLGINANEYPDFQEINGANFTTIPFPFITPIIGGIDENSKYKNSVRNIIAGGKIGDSDIIDETFLLNDLINDNLGQSILTHDLEQIRYFNKNFNMNDLLKINPMQDIGGGEFLGIVGIHSDGMFNYTLPGQFTDYNLMPFGYENMSLIPLELGINTYAAAAVFGGNGDPTEGDYQILPQVGTAIDNEGREWKTYDVITVIERVFRPFNYRIPLPDIVSDINIEPDYLATLPFPYYYEEFDVNQDVNFNTLDYVYWLNTANRPDIFHFLYKLFTGQNQQQSNDTSFTDYTYPQYAIDYINFAETNIDDTSDMNLVANEVFPPFEGDVDISPFLNIPTIIETNRSAIYWDGELNKFPMESSVGQIFIGDNSDLNLRQNCKLELNTGELSGKSIYDSSGNSNKGILIGDYKIKKNRKGEPMRRDSFIKVPKKTNNRRGAL